MKKVLALTLVLVLAISMSTVAFAAGYKIDRAGWTDANFGTPNVGTDGGDGMAEVKIPILAAGLSYASGQTTTGSVVATSGTTYLNTVKKDDVKKTDMSVRVNWSKGSQLFDKAEIAHEGSTVDAPSYVSVKFKTEVATVKDIEYKFTVRMMFGRSTAGGDGIVFEGTYDAGAWLEEDFDDDYFPFSGRNSVKPGVFIRNMEFGFNDDVSVWGRALKDVKYYGFADDNVTDADQALMVDNAAIVGVFHLTQVNVKSVAEYVTLNNSDSSMYVYDGNLNYLGRGDAKLPYSDTYYLAAAELDTDTEEPADEEEVEEPDYDPDLGNNVDGGGDDLYPENPHDNPGTGK